MPWPEELLDDVITPAAPLTCIKSYSGILPKSRAMQEEMLWQSNQALGINWKLTRRRCWPDGCWYCVANCSTKGDPAALPELWPAVAQISKKIAIAVCFVSVHRRQAVVPPIPTS